VIDWFKNEGQLLPIKVDSSGRIEDGNLRYYAAIKAGYKTVPTTLAKA